VLATDVDATLLERARAACYPGSSLRELPPAWIDAAFGRQDDRYCLRECWRSCVEFRRQDLRTAQPPGPFDLVLCRNAAFTYFDEAAQRRFAARLAACMAPGGFLVVGRHETPPPAAPFVPWMAALGIHRRTALSQPMPR
jgi:chemotaxis protein methyltransferase CheR